MTSSSPYLPVEVLNIILQHAPDLPTIYKFICASASANAAFEINQACILDHAIERSIPEFKHLARMVAILGSYSVSTLHPTFEDLVHKYERLPKDVLSTAPASYAFEFRTAGPRYLVLTAYRIEVLQHTCFVSLLQNVHEAMWSDPYIYDSKFLYYPIKKARDSVQFQAAAWWSPSWVEKKRITRAFWKLMIYWNIQAINPELKTDDYRLYRYKAAIKYISPCIGPHFSSQVGLVVYHEVEEMKCVLEATRDFLRCTDDTCDRFTPFSSLDSPNFQIEKWTSSPTFKETLHWRLEEPRPMEGIIALHDGQDSISVNNMNTRYRLFYWNYWFADWLNSGPRSHSYDPQFPDYLGLCIWDYKRLGYLGLADMHSKFLDPYLGPLRVPSNHSVVFSTRIPVRWQDLFMQEVLKLRGGQSRQIPEGLGSLIEKWYPMSQPI